jgi:hypothetical protein
MGPELPFSDSEWQERDEAEILKCTEWMGRAMKYREKPECRTYIFGTDKRMQIVRSNLVFRFL